MKKFITALLLLLITTAGAFGQELDIQTPTSNLTVQPGETTTIPFVISGNNGTYNASLDLPEDWNVVMFEDRFDMNERRTELITVRVPSTALKGGYPIEYEVRGVSSVAVEQITITVPEKREVVATVRGQESAVIAGRGFESTLVLENRSNVPVNLSLDAYDNIGETDGYDNEVTMEPGEVREYQLRTETNNRQDRARDHYLRMDVTDTETGDVISARNSRPVIPLAQETGLDYHTYPLEFGWQTAYQDRFNERTWLNQYWLSGDGPLRAGSPTSFEFMAKTPAIEGLDFKEDAYSIFPLYSEYYLTVDNPLWRIDLGDRYFEATDLTGNTASGFGAGAEYTGKAEVGVFYTQQRRFDNGREQFGARTGYNWGDRLYTGLNVGWTDGYYSGEAASFVTETEPTDYTEFRGEVSMDRSGGDTGNSYFVEGRVGSNNHFVSGGYENYSDHNPSWDRGSLRYHGSAATSWLDTRFSTRYYHVENDLFGSYEDDTWRFGVDRSRVGVYYRIASSIFNNSFSSREVDEDAVGGNIRIGPRYLYFTGRTEFTWYEYLTDPTVDFAREEEYRGTLTTQLDGFRASVGADYRLGARQFSPENRETLGLNSNVNYEWYRSSVGVSSNAYRYQNRNGGWNSNHRAYAQHTLQQGSTLRLEGIYRDFFRDEWGVRGEVTVPINVPIHKSQKTGLVWGMVTDENDNPVSGVPVYVNGYASVTNDEGKYYIGSIEPGDYEIDVDQSALDVNDIVLGTDGTIPVYPAQKSQANIKVIEGVGVTGTAVLEDGTPAYNQVVEISNGEDSFRRVTDSNGRVSFNGMMPGKWNVRMVDELNDYTSDGEYQSFELESGDVGEFEFMVQEKKQVEFVNEEPEEVENEDKDEFKWYVVKEGDWLSRLAQREYQDMFKWPVIYDANMERIEDPDLIYPGQEIIIPIIK